MDVRRDLRADSEDELLQMQVRPWACNQAMAVVLTVGAAPLRAAEQLSQSFSTLLDF
jgi:hypothetical protein